MKWFAWLVVLAAAVPVLAAQNPADTSEDAEVQQLQRQLRQRWNERVRHDLNLSDEQAAKLQGTEGKYQHQRRDLAQHQQAVNEALREQLRRRIQDIREQRRARGHGLGPRGAARRPRPDKPPRRRP